MANFRLIGRSISNLFQHHYDFHYLQDPKIPVNEKAAKYVKRGASTSENDHLVALSVSATCYGLTK